MDYVKYFFLGYRTVEMNASVLSLLGTVRFALLFLVGGLAQGLANQFSKGNYTLDLATAQGYVMPGIAVILNFIWKFSREATNPFVTTLPDATATSTNLPV